MLLRAPWGNAYVIAILKGPVHGGPMQCMGGAEPGAERL